MGMNYTCPYCKRVNDRHQTPGDAEPPSPGDVSLCWGCLVPGVFTETGVRKATTEELARIHGDPEIMNMLATMVLSGTPVEAVERMKRTGK